MFLYVLAENKNSSVHSSSNRRASISFSMGLPSFLLIHCPLTYIARQEENKAMLLFPQEIFSSLVISVSFGFSPMSVINTDTNCHILIMPVIQVISQTAYLKNIKSFLIVTGSTKIEEVLNIDKLLSPQAFGLRCSIYYVGEKYLDECIISF